MNKQSRFLKYFAVFFLIATIILIGSFFGFLKPITGFLTNSFSPVVSFFDKTFNNLNSTTRKSGQSDFIKENEELKNQIKKLTLENSILREVAIENQSLRKQLEFIENVPQKTLAAEVIVRNPSSFSKTIVINRGENHGIKKGMAVTSEGFFIGKVLETNPFNSVIILLTDSNFEISAFIQQSRALGVVKGQIGSGLAIEMIPQDKDVNINDTVITSYLQSEIPEGLIIGKVNEIDKEKQGLFQRASIVPFVNLDEIKQVVIVLGR